jgi:hypothetical protein
MKGMKYKKMTQFVALLLIFVIPIFSYAATTGDQDTGKTLVDKINDLLGGEYGLLLVVGSFFYGAVKAAMSHSFTPLLIGIGLALGIHYGPGLLTQMFGAVI